MSENTKSQNHCVHGNYLPEDPCLYGCKSAPASILVMPISLRARVHRDGLKLKWSLIALVQYVPTFMVTIAAPWIGLHAKSHQARVFQIVIGLVAFFALLFLNVANYKRERRLNSRLL